jgi:hypothetical protein
MKPTLPENPTRDDSHAYVYLRERPDVWAAWQKYAAVYRAAPPSAIAQLIRLHGIPINTSLAQSFARIYHASRKVAA